MERRINKYLQSEDDAGNKTFLFDVQEVKTYRYSDETEDREEIVRTDAYTLQEMDDKIAELQAEIARLQTIKREALKIK